jgi:hypothetical protein
VPEISEQKAGEIKKIDFANHIYFRAADGNFSILKQSDRTFSAEDLSMGIMSGQEKIDFSFGRLLGGLPHQLHNPNKNMSEERKVMVEALRSGEKVFVPLEKNQVGETFTEVASLFSEAELGVLIFPENGQVMNQFSAIRYPDGRIARLIGAENRQDSKEFLDKLNLLVPKTEVREIDKKKIAYAVEFVTDGERPITVTREEIEDWIERVRESGIIFGFDVGEDDSSLDNFTRKDGKLFWVDGNIFKGTIASDQEKVEEFIETQRKILNGYLK